MKWLLRFCPCFLLCLVLVFSAGFISFASSLPNGVEGSTVNISPADLISVSKSVWGYTYSSSEQRWYNTLQDVSWSLTEFDARYEGFDGITYTYTGYGHGIQSMTQIYNLSALSNVTNSNGIDLFLSLDMRIYWPLTGSNKDTFFSDVFVHPIYTNDDGQSQMDKLHALNFSRTSTFNQDIDGVYSTASFFDFSGENWIGISSSWIPDGYHLSGVAFTFPFATGDGQYYYQYDKIPENTRFYFSGMTVKSFTSSDLTTSAINSQTERLEGALADQTEQLEYAINESTEQQTEELTNGWNPEPKSPDGADDVNNYDDAESELLDSQADALDEATTLFGGIGDTFSFFASGFTFLIGIFNLMVGIEWLSVLVSISLALGIVAFLLNIIPAIGSKISRDHTATDKHSKGG